MQLGEVLRGPTLRGAMTSLLGPNYVQHPHRTMHTRADEIGGDQDFHKDGHHIPIRHHFPRWVICFYYPMETLASMGPTAVLRGGQYYTTDKQDATGSLLAGTWSDDRLLRADPTHYNAGTAFKIYSDADLKARDAKLAQDLGHLPFLKEEKVLIPAGTLAVLHYGTLSRPKERKTAQP